MCGVAGSAIDFAFLLVMAFFAAFGVIALQFMYRLRKTGKIETKKGVYTWTPKEASKTE